VSSLIISTFKSTIKSISCSIFTIFIIAIPLGSVAQEAIKLGVWEVDNGLECSETFTFLSDKELLLESADQIATKAYKLKPYRKTGFYVFSQRTTSHNGQVNCVGSQGMQIDSRFKVYIRLNESGDEMSFYTSTNLKDKINVVARKREVEQAPEGGEEELIVYDTPIEF